MAELRSHPGPVGGGDESSGLVSAAGADRNAVLAFQPLGVSRSSVYGMIHMSGFPSMKLRGRRLISAELLAEWVRRQAGG